MRRVLLQTLALGIVVASCRSAYHRTMETFGYDKRDLLMEQVADAQESQLEAKNHLHRVMSSLGRMETLVPSQLEALQSELDDHVGETQDRIEDLRGDMASIRSAADALYEEWRKDLPEYETDALRERSRQQLRRTQAKVGELLTMLNRTAHQLSSVMPGLRDQVMFLRHHVNAGTTPSRLEQMNEVRDQVSSVIQDLEGSIKSTERFIDEGVIVEA